MSGSFVTNLIILKMFRCLRLFVLFLFVGLCYGATSGRQPAKPVGAISEKGKDQRQPTPTAFANAGNKPGIEVWRIVVNIFK